MGHAGVEGRRSTLECFIGKVSSGGEARWDGTRPAAGPKPHPTPYPCRALGLESFGSGRIILTVESFPFAYYRLCPRISQRWQRNQFNLCLTVMRDRERWELTKVIQLEAG